MTKIKWIVFVTSAAIFGAVLSGLLKPDSPLEELTEAALKNETGADVDLSPGKGDSH